MDVATNQHAKHDTPSKPNKEQPKDTPKSENGSTTSPAEAERNDDARQTLKDAKNDSVELDSIPETKETPVPSLGGSQSDVKQGLEPRPEIDDGDVSAKATDGNEGAQQTSEAPVDKTAYTTQPLKVEKAPSIEKTSTRDQPTSYQKSSETEHRSEEAKLGTAAVDLPVSNPSNTDERDEELVMADFEPNAAGEELGKRLPVEVVPKTGHTEHDAMLQESPAKDDEGREPPPGKAEQKESSVDTSVMKQTEEPSQKAPDSSLGELKDDPSISEKQKLENKKMTGKVHGDPVSERLTVEKSAQEKSSQEKPANNDPSPQENPSQSNPPRVHPAQGQVLSSLEGKQTSGMFVQKSQSQVKNESNSPSQKETRPLQQAKEVQQTASKALQSDQLLQPQLTQQVTDKTMIKHVASQTEKQEVKQDSTTGSAHGQHKSAPTKQTPIAQSNQQTQPQPQKAIRMTPAIQKQAPAAAQRLTRVPLAAAQQGAHQPAKLTVPGKTAGLVSKAAAKPASASKQTTQMASQQLSNAKQSSRALQVARLVMNFLGPGHPPPQDPQLPTLNSLRTRLFADPNHYDARADQLAWQTREAIRTEFFKVLYPSPPPNSLLTLVTAAESIFAPFQPRPFFFPGARVAVPTEAGSRRAATSLQLRFKKVDRTTVAEALLHLDGPNGGGFQWVQAPALTPLSLYAPQPSRTVQKKTKRPRAPRATKPRKKREKALPPAPPVPPKPISQPPIAPNSRPAPKSSAALMTQTQLRTQTISKTSIQVPVQAPKPTRTSVPTPSPSPTPQPIPAPRLAGVVARLARQEASGVYVPDALRGTSPPPRASIVGQGRFVSHVSGAMRSAFFDIDKILGIERLVARRVTANTIEYFVKWSGVPLREGSWESRDALLKDVPGLVRDFDVRHPEKKQYLRAHGPGTSKLKEIRKGEGKRKESAQGRDEREDSCEVEQNEKLTRKGSVSGEIVASLVDGKDESKSKEDAKKEVEDKKNKAPVKQYIDDVTGLPIPSWLDTPIVELSIAGMVLQIRRPNEAILHNDATSAVRDAKKRQTRFKQENILLGERLFPLTKPEAKSVIDAAAKDHRQHNRVPIPFPRGIGRVSPTDHGYPFAREDVLKAPPSWEAYFLHVGMVPTDYSRSLPPHMPTLDEASQSKLMRARDELAFSTACEHRERARLLLRESFRHTGAPPPEHIFRDGIRAPPGEHLPITKKRDLVAKSGEGGSKRLLRTREPAIETALKRAKTLSKDKNSVWFDEIWACWRPEPN